MNCYRHVQKAKVYAMLAPKMPHGAVYTSTDDVYGALVVTILLKGELAAFEPLEDIEHGNPLELEHVTTSYKK